MILGNRRNISITIQCTHELIVASMGSLPATVFHGAYKDPIGSVLGNHAAKKDNTTQGTVALKVRVTTAKCYLPFLLMHVRSQSRCVVAKAVNPPLKSHMETLGPCAP